MKILLAALMILILAQAAQAGDWPMFRHDAAHTGVADEAVEPPLELLWTFEIEEGVYSSPAVLDGFIYVGSYDNYTYALDASNGNEKWQYETGGIISSSPAVSGGMVYIGSWDNNVYALDAAN